MRVRYIVAGVLIYAVSVVSGTAHAATRAEQTAACKGDALKYCTFSIPNEKKIAACLEAKKDKISPACRAMIEPPKPAHKKKKS